MVATKLAWLQERKGCDRKGSLLGEEMRTIGMRGAPNWYQLLGTLWPLALKRDQTDGMPVLTIVMEKSSSELWFELEPT